MSYVSSKLYWKCLSEYCPAGLLVIPRDLDTEAKVESDGNAELEGGDYIGGSDGFGGVSGASGELAVLEGLDWGSVCHQGRGDPSQPCTTKDCVAMSLLPPARQSALESSMLQLCWLWRCRDEASSSEAGVLQCLRDKCCQHPAPPPPSLARRPTPALTRRAPDPPLARKRRVNDEVAQCIQSYCSGKHVYNNRMWCIVNKCNRG